MDNGDPQLLTLISILRKIESSVLRMASLPAETLAAEELDSDKIAELSRVFAGKQNPPLPRERFCLCVNPAKSLKSRDNETTSPIR